MSSKITYMLHSFDDLKPVKTYKVKTYRDAAMKAIKEGYKDILVRKVGNPLIKYFKGEVEQLDPPKIVKRGDREIVYKHVNKVKLQKSFKAEVDYDA